MKEQRQYAADVEHVKKNPDFYRARMEAMERARQKQEGRKKQDTKRA